MNIVSDLYNDLALWRGWAVFEAVAARGNTLFHWDDHYARLVQSCIGARIPFDCGSSSALEYAVRDEIALRSYKESLVKILVTRGRSHNHSTPVAGSSALLISVLPFPVRSPRPLKLEVQRGIREFPHIKLAGGYGYTMLRAEIAAEHGCDDFLFSSPETGITEASVGNVFFIWRNAHGVPILSTPDHSILRGVTRRIVLEVARRSTIFNEVCDLAFQGNLIDIFTRDPHAECFITSTTRGIHPVQSIVDTNGAVFTFCTGPETITEKLKAMFLEYREAYFAKHGA